MTINLSLSTASINSLINRLEDFKGHIGEELVNILCIEGADEANIAYDGMASAQGYVESAEEGVVTGKIVATSSNSDKLLIAEFGAGDATLESTKFFESNELQWMIFPGAYSLLNPKGTMDYWRSGMWEYPYGSGNWYEKVDPRQGLYSAKTFVRMNYARLANEVVRID